MRTHLPPLWLCCAAAGAVVAACGDDLTRPPPQFDNVVDTATLYALTGTAIDLPSGFDGVTGATARTDLNAPFDFAVDLEAGNVLRLFPTGALGLLVDPGIVIVTETFDGVASAPLEGYARDSALTAQVGTVFVLRSRASNQQCAIGALPRYGKFRVLAVDPDVRTVTLEFLIDFNCGYRGLEPGTPVD
jgi:hypothetical protein